METLTFAQELVRLREHELATAAVHPADRCASATGPTVGARIRAALDRRREARIARRNERALSDARAAAITPATLHELTVLSCR